MVLGIIDIGEYRVSRNKYLIIMFYYNMFLYFIRISSINVMDFRWWIKLWSQTSTCIPTYLLFFSSSSEKLEK